MMESLPDLPQSTSQQGDPDPPPPSQPRPEVDHESLRLYNLALNFRWPHRHVFRHIAPDPPVFVYGSLMLPWVLARVLDHDQNTAEVEEIASFMTPATLSGFSRVMVKYTQVPTLVQTQDDNSNDGAEVEGMLIGSVNKVDLGKVEEYIGLQNHEQDIVEVEITRQGGDKMIVAAFVYVWKGPSSALYEKEWDVLEYMGANSLGTAGTTHPALEVIFEEESADTL